MTEIDPVPLQELIKGWIPDPSDLQLHLQLFRGELFKLIKENSIEAINTLLVTANYEPADPVITDDCIFALQILAKQSSQSAIDGLFELAVLHGNNQAANWLITNKCQTQNAVLQLGLIFIYIPKDHVELNKKNIRLLDSLIFKSKNELFIHNLFTAAQKAGYNHWVLLAKFLLQPCAETTQDILDNFPAMNKLIQELLVEEIAYFAHSKNVDGQNLLCLIAIQYDHLIAWKEAVQLNARPIDLNTLAIFLYLSEQWDEYNQLDFNGQIIVNAFHNSTETVRQKLLSHGRKTGKIDWLNQISEFSRSRWIGAIGDADWQSAITHLLAKKDFQQLWKLALNAPAVWSARIVTKLGLQNFIPDNLSENQWEKIHKAAEEALLGLLPIIPSSVLPTSIGLFSRAAISQDATCLVISGQDQRITYFTIPDMIEQKSISSLSNYSILTMALSKDEVVIGTDDSSIRVIRFGDQRVLKNIQTHSGLIKSLLVDAKHQKLYSAGFDKKIFLYHFPESMVTGSAQADSEVFFLTLVGKKRILACAEASGQISLWNGDTLVALANLDGHKEAVLFLSSGSENDLLVSYGREKSICVWNVSSRKLLNHLKIEESLIDLALIPDGSALLGLTDAGELIAWNISTMQIISRQKFKEYALKRIFPLSNSNQVLGITIDSRIMVFNFGAQKIFTQPLSEINTINIKEIKKLLINSAQGTNWADYIDSIYAIKHQHDIEIGEKLPISVGEFDIQL